MVEQWRKQLHQLAGGRLIKELENAAEPFTIATAYRQQATVKPGEMRLILEVEVKFAPAPD